MSGKTTIEWTAMPGYAPAVWNPTTGCTRVSAGCDNCYAFALHDKRYASNKERAKSYGYSGVEAAADARENEAVLPWPRQYDLPFSRVQLLEDRLDVPLRTRKPTCYFVDSMSDLFHEDVVDDFIAKLWNTMGRAQRHRFLILTKRPQRMREWVTAWAHRPDDDDWWDAVLPNVWLGVSVEDQRAADERIPHLLATPAAVRFLSCEPLLEDVWLDLAQFFDACPSGCGCRAPLDADRFECGCDGPCTGTDDPAAPDDWLKRTPKLSWLIVGGESGPRARPMDLAWARSLRDQCAAAGVSFFMKQLGSKPLGRTMGFSKVEGGFAGEWTTAPMKLRESHGRNPDEWPEDLRIRTWPR